MTGNRVEQLESRVRELEASIDGLLDELVDTKDRLENVERAVTTDERTTRRTDIVEGELLGDDDHDGATGDHDGATDETEAQRVTETTFDDGDDTDDDSAENADRTDGIIVA